jgi:hypothetical protein
MRQCSLKHGKARERMAQENKLPLGDESAAAIELLFAEHSEKVIDPLPRNGLYLFGETALTIGRAGPVGLGYV